MTDASETFTVNLGPNTEPATAWEACPYESRVVAVKDGSMCSGFLVALRISDGHLHGMIELYPAFAGSPALQDTVHPLWATLHEHCVKGEAAEFDKIIKDNPDIDINGMTWSQDPFLHTACYNNSLDIVKSLLAHPKINVNVLPVDQRTAFFYACSQGHTEVVNLLLKDVRVDTTRADFRGISPLEAVATRGYIGILKAMIGFGNAELFAQVTRDAERLAAKLHTPV
jgi:hypothetical protein